MTLERSLVVRTYNGATDAEAIAELVNSSRLKTTERASVSAEQVVSFMEEASIDPKSDVHLFFDGESLVAYERTRRETWSNDTRVYHVAPFIHANWRRAKVIAEIIEHMLEYHLEFARTDKDGERPFLAIIPGPTDFTRIDALVAAGFELCHSFLSMARPLEQIVELQKLPLGLEMRPLERAHYRAVYEFDRRIMKDHWGVEVATQEHFQWWAEEAFLNPELWRVAWHGDTIVGTAAGIVGGTWNPSLGNATAEIRFVRVAPDWRRSGVASALIRQCLNALYGQGIRTVVLDVDSENEKTAAALYQSLGFEIRSRMHAYCYNLTAALQSPKGS